MADMIVRDARRILGRRIGPWIALADVDDAMARSARLAGLTLSGTARVTDADLAALSAAKHDEFLDVAELRCWMSILGNATDSGLRDVGLDDSVRDVRDVAEAVIKSQEKYAKDVYGVGLATLEAGTINLNFAAGADDTSCGEW